MKKIVTPLILTLLLLAPSVFAESFSAQIFVSDFDDAPIANMEVLLYDQSEENLIKKGVTNSEGKIEITLFPGNYSLQLKKDGEVKKNTQLNIPELEGREVYNSVVIQVLYEERSSFEIENLTFETASAEIDASSYVILDRLFTYLMSEPSTIYEIAGHTDSRGSESANLALSQKRAEAVKAYLIAKGIPASRLVAKGYGESSPVADNETEAGMAANRRTEVVSLGQAK